MMKLRNVLPQQVLLVCGTHQQPWRSISALYITGDKAKENYVTLLPYMDFKQILTRREALESSIAKRKLQLNLNDISQKYENYTVMHDKLKQIEQEREAVVQRLKELTKSSSAGKSATDELKTQGKTLRQQLKDLKRSFYPEEDDFIHAFLNLPNVLHADCPSDEREKLLYRSPLPRPSKGEAHLKREDLIRFLDNGCYYMMLEAAEFDVNCTQALTRHYADAGDFLQTANPDFVRAVLLEANATPVQQYHQVMEENLQNQLNVAYLAGGASFESFLALVTKLCVYPSVLPLRMVACGRNYRKMDDSQATTTRGNLYTATQSNAVQTFVATVSASEADAEMDRILNLAVDFYQALGIHFRIVYADASELTAAECLRAVIEVYSPAEQRYVTMGHVSNYSDYVSKRILFSMRQQKDYHFLHLVGGPVLYTTRLIAALVENGIPLAGCKLLGATSATEQVTPQETAIDEFKNIFK